MADACSIRSSPSPEPVLTDTYRTSMICAKMKTADFKKQIFFKVL